jgi:electron transfer flavoprotein alpha subunit
LVEHPELLAFSEDERMLAELLSKGRELSDKVGMQLTCIVAGDTTETLASKAGEFGVDTVLVAESDTLSRFDAEVYCALITSIVKDRNPEIVLIGATKRGKELAPRLATRLKTGCMADCIALDIEPETRSLIGTRLMYAGKATAKETCRTRPQIATVPPRVFEMKPRAVRKPKRVEVTVPSVLPRVSVKEIKRKEAGVANIEDASVVVCGGRGVRSKEDFKLLEELAKVLNGQVGCSRPIAADLGWFPEWIGLSGHKVHPTLYVGCGVSGAIQHLAGISEARTVVAINNNPDSPIFAAVDYGIVGDLYQVVPALTESLRKRS